MIQINNRDPRPIYQQIKDGFQRLMVSGILPPDEKLPSVRELASQLAINPNTIQRAYRELEAEGYLYTVPGKGAFAAGETETQNRYKQELYQNLDTVVQKLLSVGERPEDIATHLSQLTGKERNHL